MKFLAFIAFILFSQASFADKLIFSCVRTHNGNGESSLNNGTGWENFTGELIVEVDSSTASASAKGGSSEYPRYEGEHRNNAWDVHLKNGTILIGFLQRPFPGARRVIYIPENLLLGKSKMGQIILNANNTLKQKAEVFFDCSLIEFF